MTHELADAKYMSFTSFKRDGTPVATPVWVVPFEGGYAFTTGTTSFKLRRVAANPRVEVAVCGVRGTVRADAVRYTGSAEVLSPEAARRVNAAIRRKYWIVYHLAIAPSAWWERRRGGDGVDAAIKVSLDT